jgi:hypothetical protein
MTLAIVITAVAVFLCGASIGILAVLVARTRNHGTCHGNDSDQA